MSDEYEEGDGLSVAGHMVAGSCAGVAEHCVFFPIDTLKTRIQTMPIMPNAPQHSSVAAAVTQIVKQEGVARLYRGVSAVVLAAIPSHALYFAVYEASKASFQRIGARNGGGVAGENVANMCAGAMATVVHDAAVTPLDVIKQRLQLHGSAYKGVSHAFASIYAKNGLRAFYASYGTTLSMNVPHFALYFATYEAFKKGLFGLTQSSASTSQAQPFSPLVHCTAGAAAGAIASGLSNPLDVVKTRLQTMGEVGVHYSGPVAAARVVLAQEGMAGFFRGATVRMMYSAPSAALIWVTYEYLKYSLSDPIFNGVFIDEPDKFRHLRPI